MNLCMSVRLSVRVHGHLCKYVYVCALVRICVYVCVRARLHVLACVYACMCLYV